MIEQMTWKKYLNLTNAKVIDSRFNDIEGTKESLMAYKYGKILVCACPSTARVYALEVNEECQTCKQAQSYLSCGLSERIISAS